MFSGIAVAQISGQLFQYESEFPGVQVYFKYFDQKVESDFDGHFKLPIPSGTEEKDLIIDLGGMIIEIQNVELGNGKLDLGKIQLPVFKSIEIVEFEQLSESEKASCYPIYCWTELLGYLYSNKLEHKYLTMNCQQKITDFEYDSTTKTVKVEWNSIKDCQ